MNTTIEMPERIALLPRDEKERPVPFFVACSDGKPADFRVVDPTKLAQCYYLRLCFICGQKLGTYMAFVVGPMCTVSRISAEPPSHLQCAEYAAQVCPFLANPRKSYRDTNLPEGCGVADHSDPETGIWLQHNPGVTAIWVTKAFKPLMRGGDLLARFDEPTTVLWYTEGRKATRAEVATAFEYGASKFYELAGDDYSTKAFERDMERTKKYWPQA